ncbi:hypothetical protein LINGRAHAP2_LOCUS10469 [Linum grandiflorum]
MQLLWKTIRRRF